MTERFRFEDHPLIIQGRCRRCRQAVLEVRSTPAGPVIKTWRYDLATDRHHDKERDWLDHDVASAARDRLQAIAEAEWPLERAASRDGVPEVNFSPLLRVVGDGTLIEAACARHGTLDLSGLWWAYEGAMKSATSHPIGLMLDRVR
ncbi:MAG: hypothetical protein WD598_16355 [Acidimicrobiia bacterium]